MNSNIKSYDCYMNDQGKVTIPKHIRKKYNLDSDTNLKWECRPDGIFIKILDPEDLPEQLTIDQLDTVKAIIKKTHGTHAPNKTVKLYNDKCCLCGCKSGLELHSGAAYCKSCFERKRDFDKQFEEITKKVKERNKYVDNKGRKYKYGI